MTDKQNKSNRFLTNFILSFMFQSEQSLISLASTISQDEIPTQSFNKEENDRFSKHHPFVNLMILTVGPFLTTFGMSILDSIDLMIISQRFKHDPSSYAVQIIGIGFFVQQICIYIGMFLQQAIIVRVSSLIGEGKRTEACQLTVDIFRISIIFNIFATTITTFIARPIMNFAGCTPDLIERCMLLIISSIAGLPFTTIFHISTGYLQAIGKAVLNGVLHLAANCLQTFIITPFLQFVLKIDVTFSNISQPIAQSIIGLIVFKKIFFGSYSLKPSFNMLFKKFSPETSKALIMALPMIPVWLYDLLPSSLILRFMTTASTSDKLKRDVIGVYTVLQKIFLFGMALPMALSIGFLTAATHSMSQHNYKRMLVTLNYALLVILIFFAIFTPFIIINPAMVMNLFDISSPSQIRIAKKMVPIPMYTFSIGMICAFFVNFFIVVDKTLYSNLVALFQLISLCVGSKVLFHFFPNDPMKQMFSYTISDVSTSVVTIILFLVTLIPFLKKMKKSNETLLSGKFFN